MEHPKKIEKGKINAFILNKMRFRDARFMDEYSLRPLINRRFKCHLRANEVRKLHLDPLCDRHWLKKVVIPSANGYTVVMYRRYAGFDHVRPEETIRDRFANLYIEYPNSSIEDTYTEFLYMEQLDYEAWLEPDFVGSFTEKEYEEYSQKEYEEYMKSQEENKKLKKADPDFLDHLLD